ncbi:PHD finger protein 7-like [Pseudopipra pipra]
MVTMGIRIPFRLVSFCLAHNTGGASAVLFQGLPQQSWPCPFPPPSWEGINVFTELGERHRHCDARECLFPGGRQEAEEEGPWELLWCSSCAAEGTHRPCSGLRDSISSWEWDGCAGLGTAPMEEPELDSPSLSTQSGLEPSHEPKTISPSTGDEQPQH